MAKLPTVRESRMRSDGLDRSDASDKTQAIAMARRWLATHPRPRPLSGDPFPEDHLMVRWSTTTAVGVIMDPWTLMEDAIAEIGKDGNIRSAIWMIHYIMGRVQ